MIAQYCIPLYIPLTLKSACQFLGNDISCRRFLFPSIYEEVPTSKYETWANVTERGIDSPHCIVGKQTRSSVPSICEGRKVVRQLEKVYVDLCGLMPTASKAGALYSMNIIDDFSSYIWTIPLKAKSKAASTFQDWHCVVTTQTGKKLSSFLTDNGELVSKNMEAWCKAKGINHQLMAPICLHKMDMQSASIKQSLGKRGLL